jgi:hypothetical protein
MSSTTTSSGDESNEIPNSVIDELREAGASRIFLRVIQTPTDDLDGVTRNSARQEILKYIDWSDDGTVNGYLNYGGGFFQSLFNDDNPEGSADANNEKILRQLR